VPRDKHTVSKADIDDNALKVLNRLNSSGFEAYLVGGSIRDLLLKKSPKDFDVATNATPNEIKRLFRNARIIGRRFKLVHVLFGRGVVEVATFRGTEALDDDIKTNERGMLIRDNVYGTLNQDAWRRDFTINSLYYNIQDSSIVDFTNGVNDIKLKQIRMIGEPEKRYQEDPVRMLRAIRFAAKLHFTIESATAKPIKPLAHLISHVSSSRLFDEMTKLYQCGEGEAAHDLLVSHGLFDLLFPDAAKLLKLNHTNAQTLTKLALESTDNRLKDDKTVNPAFLFAVLLWFPLRNTVDALINEGKLDPLPAIEKGMSIVLSKQCGITAIPKRFTQVIREIWLLQYRFQKRQGNRAYHLLGHPRFRAAYDFLALRALANDEDIELANWWTTFQEADDDTKKTMVDAINASDVKKPKRRRKKKPSTPPTSAS